jgi:hypothetical protein
MERVFFLLNAAFAMAILDLISHVHFAKNNYTRVLYLKKLGKVERADFHTIF